jgi:hypothetical protein
MTNEKWKPLGFNNKLKQITKQTNDEKVFIERAAPLTKNGIRSMSCSEEEYNWYITGLIEGSINQRQKIIEKIRKFKSYGLKGNKVRDELIKQLEKTK